MYVNQEATVSFAAVDSDLTNGRADSLVYTLDRPLNGCGSFETYANLPAGYGCAPGLDPACPTRIIRCAGFGSTYSATLPIAVANDTVRTGATCNPGVVTFIDIRPKFVFTAAQASFRFTPNRYLNTPSANGDNKYVRGRQSDGVPQDKRPLLRGGYLPARLPGNCYRRCRQPAALQPHRLGRPAPQRRRAQHHERYHRPHGAYLQLLACTLSTSPTPTTPPPARPHRCKT